MKGMQYNVGHVVGSVEADSDVAQDVGMVEVLHESTFSQEGLQLLLGRVACMQQGHVFTTCNMNTCLLHLKGTCVHYMPQGHMFTTCNMNTFTTLNMNMCSLRICHRDMCY